MVDVAVAGGVLSFFGGRCFAASNSASSFRMFGLSGIGFAPFLVVKISRAIFGSQPSRTVRRNKSAARAANRSRCRSSSGSSDSRHGEPSGLQNAFEIYRVHFQFLDHLRGGGFVVAGQEQGRESGRTARRCPPVGLSEPRRWPTGSLVRRHGSVRGPLDRRHGPGVPPATPSSLAP